MENLSSPTFPGTAGLERLDQEVFTQILQAHKLWLNSEGKEGRRANLKDTDLRHISFTGANLVQASLRGVNLEGVDLRGAQLHEADFTEARLIGANLSNLQLRRVNFASAMLDRAILDQADVSYSNFLNAQLNEASLRGANLERAVLRQAQIARTNFDGANLTDANGRESNFTGAKFHNTNLERTDMRDSKFDFAEFVDARFMQTPFKGSSFNHVSFTQSDFKEALEISPEYRSAAYKEEKEALEGQLQAVKNQEETLSQKQQELQKKLAEFDVFSEYERVASERLHKNANTLKKLSIIWGVLSLLIAAGIGFITLSLASEDLKLTEVMVVLVIDLLLLALFVGTLLSVRGAVRHVLELAILRESKRLSLHTEGVENTHHQPQPAPAFASDVQQSSDELTLNLPEPTRRKGFFGKKA
ncbi:MAG: pentapeptide repeat-containing protein [Rickettsiales bacterium]|nr:pentapeptide repeat-containing protein [Rickettsiales bacterium]